MSALKLTPKGSEYLRTDILANQFDQNSIDLTLTDYATANVQPKLRLDGAGRAYLSGSITLTDDVAIVFKLFNLPRYLQIENSTQFIVSKFSDGSFTSTGLFLQSNSAGISAVVLGDTGSFTSQPSFALNGPGSGAIVSPRIRVTSAVLASNPTGGTSYAPGQGITFAGGTFIQASTLLVATTGVYEATISGPGTGGVDGTQTVTGTTGTGTKFTASVTVAGGFMTEVLSVVTAGSYTANPANIADEPVTGASLTDARLTIKMKPITFTVSITGNYSTIPTNPVAQASSTGSGLGITLTATWQFLNIGVLDSGSGYDSTSTITFTGAGSAAATLAILSDSTQIYAKLSDPALANDVISLDGIAFFVKPY